jgi:cytochrome b subunit of formate dehydrogenase
MQAIELDSLEPVALIHTIGAYIMITFLVIHLYLITTGRTIFSNLKAMVTGWEEMDEHEAELTVKDVMDTAKQYVKESNNRKKKKK